MTGLLIAAACVLLWLLTSRHATSRRDLTVSDRTLERLEKLRDQEDVS